LEDEINEVPVVIENIKYRLQKALTLPKLKNIANLKTPTSTEFPAPYSTIVSLIPQIFPISTRIPKLTLSSSSSSSSSSSDNKSDLSIETALKWKSSGLATLFEHILAQLTDNQSRENILKQRAIFTGKMAILHLYQKEEDVLRIFRNIDNQSCALFHEISNEQDRIQTLFSVSEMAAVERDFQDISVHLKEWFDRVKFWKLFWKSDDIFFELNRLLKEFSLQEAEHRVCRINRVKSLLVTIIVF